MTQTSLDSAQIRNLRRTNLVFFVVIILVLVAIHNKITITNDVFDNQQLILQKLDNLSKQIEESTQQITKHVDQNPTSATKAPATDTAKKTSSLQNSSSYYQQALIKARHLIEQQRAAIQQPSSSISNHFSLAQAASTPSETSDNTKTPTTPSEPSNQATPEPTLENTNPDASSTPVEPTASTTTSTLQQSLHIDSTTQNSSQS